MCTYVYRCLFIKYILQTPQFDLIFIPCHVRYMTRAWSVYNVSFIPHPLSLHPISPFNLSIHHTFCVDFQRNFKIFSTLHIYMRTAVGCKFYYTPIVNWRVILCCPFSSFHPSVYGSDPIIFDRVMPLKLWKKIFWLCAN